jgi:hypothetical protein
MRLAHDCDMMTGAAAHVLRRKKHDSTATTALDQTLDRLAGEPAAYVLRFG